MRRESDRRLASLERKVDELNLLLVRGKAAVWVLGGLGVFLTWLLSLWPSIKSFLQSSLK